MPRKLQIHHYPSTFEGRTPASWEADRKTLEGLCNRLSKDLDSRGATTPEQSQEADAAHVAALRASYTLSGAELYALMDVTRHALGLHWAYGKKREINEKKAVRLRLFVSIEAAGRTLSMISQEEREEL